MSAPEVRMPEQQRTENMVGPVDLGWSVTTLKSYFDQLLVQLDRQDTIVRSHYDSLLVEYDRRYAARFLAAEQAVKDAFAAQEKAINAALAAASAAVNKAESAAEKRFEGVNEFRAQLGDQQRTLMPRSEFEAVSKGMSEKLDQIASRMDRLEARGLGGQQVFGYIVAGLGVLVGVGGLIFAILNSRGG